MGSEKLDIHPESKSGDIQQKAILNSGIFRVLIIGSQTLVCEGLQKLLDSEADFLVETSTTEDSLQLRPGYWREFCPHVILAVLACSTREIIQLSLLKGEYPDIPLLVVSAEVHSEAIKSALANGINGYLPLDASADELIAAIRKVGKGEPILHPRVIRKLLSNPDGESIKHAPVILDDFSEREQEILACLARGMSDREISQALFIGVRTVQSHLENIYAKLEVHSRTEAAVIAVQSGWCTPNSEIKNHKN